MPRALTLVLAGGAGERLQPLTRDRAKPAVPFGGRYRIVDFVLSNFWNSGLRSVFVLTQYKSQSLLDHIHAAWAMNRNLDRDVFIVPVPAQMRTGEAWYTGTADAVLQNWTLIEDHDPDLVLIFGADHIYKMDVRQMVEFHIQKKALATVACIPVPLAEARSFGIIGVDAESRIVAFQEKPQNPTPMPGRPDRALGSMGNYIFNVEFLRDLLQANAGARSHDFGKDILPPIAGTGRLYAYDFNTNQIPGAPPGGHQYWRDVGTIDAYYEANLDLKAVTPQLDLYNRSWPIRSASSGAPPTKFVFDEAGRRGMAVQSLVGGGTIVAGGYVKDSVIGRDCFIDAGSEVLESVIFDGVRIGKGVRIRRAIVDKHAIFEDGDRLGYDRDADRRRFHVSDSGIVVVPRARNPKTDISGSSKRPKHA